MSFGQESANKLLQRTRQTVTSFAKTQQKKRQFNSPLSAALRPQESMSKYKKRLIVLIVVEVVLILIHNMLKVSPSTTTAFTFEWHYVLGLAFGILVVLYALSIKCNNQDCGKRQVFRGWGISDLRWPNSNCYKCGHSLE